MEKIIDLTRLPSRFLVGRTGENEFRTFYFDCKSLLQGFEDGVITAVYQRPDERTYPVKIEMEGMVAKWTPTELEVEEPGQAELQLRMQQGDVIGKSACVVLWIDTSLQPGEKPDAPPTDWLEQTLQAATDAQAAQKAAEAAAKRAEDAAANAGGGGSGEGFVYEIGNGLQVIDNVLSVKTADKAEEDNTLPITSAAVFSEVGNINALLETI